MRLTHYFWSAIFLLVGTSLWADEASDRSVAFCTSLESQTAKNGSAVLLDVDDIAATLAKSDTVRVIVMLRQPAAFKAMTADQWDSQASLATLHAETQALSNGVLERLGKRGRKVRVYQNYAGFACNVTSDGLSALLQDSEVVSVSYDNQVKAHTKQGLPLMNAQSVTRGTGTTYTGAGISIAICDTGVDYTHPQLGGSTAVGDFPNAKVIGGYNFGDGIVDPHPKATGGAGDSHGTSCAGTAGGSIPTGADVAAASNYVGGVAFDAKIYALKMTAGSSNSAFNSDIIASWDWCVTHKNDNAENPLLIISTSFGGGNYNTPTAVDAVFGAVVTAATNAGITILASSGNDGYCASMGAPAVATNVISVGAVYDAPLGTLSGSVAPASCLYNNGQAVLDTAVADGVAFYSNSSSLLDILAPSHNNATCKIVDSSGNYTQGFGGTSSACPYAAGAVAVLQQASKAITGAYLTPAQVRSTLVTTGKNITDTRKNNGITKPRVDLGAAVVMLSPTTRPPNDDFANAYTISTSEASYEVSNVNATRETNEPNHGDATIWWQFTASDNKPVAFSTAGSAMTTTLYVYTGTALNALTEVVNGTNTVTFTPVMGTLYRVVVGMSAGTTGAVKLTKSVDRIKATLKTPTNGISYSADPNEPILFSWEYTGGTFAEDEMIRMKMSGSPDFKTYIYFDFTSDEVQYNTRVSIVNDARDSLGLSDDNAPLYWVLGNGEYDFCEPFVINRLVVPTAPSGIDSIKVFVGGSWVDVPKSWSATDPMPFKLALAAGNHIVRVTYCNVEYTFDDRVPADTDGSRLLGDSSASSSMDGFEVAAPAAGFVRFSLPEGKPKVFTITGIEIPVTVSGFELE